jgi:hypothetical protein
VSFTPVVVLMMIDQTASTKTTATRASRLTPNQITTSGTSAISGVAWKKLTYGLSIRSTIALRPIAIPTTMPTTAASPYPIPRSRSAP